MSVVSDRLQHEILSKLHENVPCVNSLEMSPSLIVARYVHEDRTTVLCASLSVFLCFFLFPQKERRLFVETVFLVGLV
jgi:hypothetical protein